MPKLISTNNIAGALNKIIIIEAGLFQKYVYIYLCSRRRGLSFGGKQIDQCLCSLFFFNCGGHSCFFLSRVRMYMYIVYYIHQKRRCLSLKNFPAAPLSKPNLPENASYLSENIKSAHCNISVSARTKCCKQ